jgi:acetyltransferase-like isoleucine patch superfamily enzyme
MKKYLTAIRKLNLKTIIFNFSYFKFAEAIRFPVLVSGKVYLRALKGTVTIKAPLKFGMIEIGYGDVGIFDKVKSRTIWHVLGNVVFENNANIGHGSKISVDTTGTIIFGNNFRITAESAVFATKQITFGANCLISWDVLIMDADVHKISAADQWINPPEAITISDDVWISCRTLILKGVYIPKGCVIAAASLVTKILEKENAIYGGVPAKLLRDNISWTL